MLPSGDIQEKGMLKTKNNLLDIKNKKQKKRRSEIIEHFNCVSFKDEKYRKSC
jgi:hypothetical protein